jgi:hypothetical protein
VARSRQWWTSHAAPGSHLQANLVTAESIGEPRWLPALAVLSAAGLYVTLPSRFVVGPSSGAFSVIKWIVPVLTLALLAPLMLSAPRTRVVHSIGRRAAAIALIAVVTAANAVAIVLLVHLLITGAKAHARELLRAAIHMWCMNVIVFGLWFWQLDGGGPMARASGETAPDFLFPQTAMPELDPGWRPRFLDYLYVSFTNATAFSPTDTLPLSRWAKVLMMVQSAAALLLALMVAARAVNILQ